MKTLNKLFLVLSVSVGLLISFVYLYMLIVLMFTASLRVTLFFAS